MDRASYHRLLRQLLLLLCVAVALLVPAAQDHVVAAGRKKGDKIRQPIVNEQDEFVYDSARLYGCGCDVLTCHSAQALPETIEFLRAVSRAHDIARSAFVGIQLEREAYVEHRDAYRGLLLRFAHEPRSDFRWFKERSFLADVATRVSGIYHVWRYVALSLEAVLDSGQPRSAVYALFEQLYMTVHGFEYDTRHIHLPMLQRQVTLARIHERRQGSAAGRHGNARHGTRSSMKTAQMKDYNERALRHVRTIAQGLANIDWLDVNSIADQVRQYARTLRRSMEEERFAADGGMERLVEDDFLDLLHVYAALAPLFAQNTLFLEELRLRFTRHPINVALGRSTKKNRNVPRWTVRRSVISRLERAGSTLVDHFTLALEREPWWSSGRDYPKANAGPKNEALINFECMVRNTHALFVLMIRTIDRIAPEVIPEVAVFTAGGLRDGVSSSSDVAGSSAECSSDAMGSSAECSSDAAGSSAECSSDVAGSSAECSSDVAGSSAECSNYLTSSSSETASSAQFGSKESNVVASDEQSSLHLDGKTCQENASRDDDTARNDNDGLCHDNDGPRNDDALHNAKVSETPARHDVCRELSGSGANYFRYTDPHFFSGSRNFNTITDKSPDDGTSHTYTHVDLRLDRDAMQVLCQLRGAVKGGENLPWSTVVKLIERSLHGSVRLKGGSRTTVFVPTPHAYAIAIDRPHPSNRIGHKIYQLRDVLFNKFRIDLDAFEGGAGAMRL